MKKTLLPLLILSCTPAYAYIGPGTGAGLAATVLGIIGALALAIIGLIYYPIKRLIKKLKTPPKKQEK